MAATSDKRVITIRIVGGGTNAAGSSLSKQSVIKDFNPVRILSEAVDNDFPTVAKVKNSALIQIAKNQAEAVILGAASYGLNRYFSLKEDYLSENVYNEIKSTVSKTVGFGKSVLSGISAGATTGSAFGPVGTAVGSVAGALIGGTGYGMQQYIQYQQKMSGYYQQLNATNAQTQFQAKRLGLSDEGQNTLN